MPISFVRQMRGVAPVSILLLLVLAFFAGTAAPAHADNPASPFLQVWKRPDYHIATNQAKSPCSGSAYTDIGIATCEQILGPNTPAVFWNFRNQRGTVIFNHARVQDNIDDWLFAMGYRVSEPYWTKVTVGGVVKDVMVKL